jgi:chitin disaccharide deacetylase
MVFMADSERAADLARQRGVDAGLHLNLTTLFSAPGVPSRLLHHQQRIVRFLTRNRIAQVFFHPGLASSFRYVVVAQLEEFRRLFGAEAARIDGHHHMHLCANVMLGGLLPAGTIARRSFSFQAGEKSAVNRLYRSATDRLLAKRHHLTDYFFSLAPVEPIERLRRIASLAQHAIVELETHPVNPDEYRFLMAGKVFRLIDDLELAHGFALPMGHRPALLQDAPQAL